MPFDGKHFRRPTPIADKMREIAGPNGGNWCKGFACDALARRCVGGILVEAMGARDDSAPMHWLACAVGQSFPDFTPTMGGIIAFNDAPRTEFADILRVIDAFAEIEATQEIAAAA